MGALHAGHRSLIKRARRTCQMVVVSVFVNPLQFGPTEDFGRYPRNLSHDLTLCREEGVDAVFLPQQDTLYPPNFQTTVSVNKLTTRWEGEHRPSHFQGVTTIVTKLLNIVRPTRLFLGQKDYQQYVVIKQLLQDLNLDMKLILCPTIRESDGLALSSRNRYLTATQRPQALLLYQALKQGRELIRKGTRTGRQVTRAMHTIMHRHPDIIVDYLACCDTKTLAPITRLGGKIVLLGAIRLDNLRLIDNLTIHIPTKDVG